MGGLNAGLISSDGMWGSRIGMMEIMRIAIRDEKLERMAGMSLVVQWEGRSIRMMLWEARMVM